MALSFEEIRKLVSQAIAEAYPAVPRDNEEPYPEARRFYISRMWSDMALLNRGYWCAESDPSYCFIKYSIDISESEPEAKVGELIPAKIQAVSDDGQLSVALESGSFGEAGEIIAEAGKRNSKKDKGAINAAIRALVGLLNKDEIDEDTLAVFSAKSAIKNSDQKESATSDDDLLLKEDASGDFFTEHLESVITGTFDKKNMVVKDHKVLGIVSRNGYTYPLDTQKAALPIFEGRKAYLNHSTHKEMQDGEARNVRDLIGYHKNLRLKEDGTYSDLYLIDNRTVQDYVLPIVESAPQLIGSSVVIRGKLKKMKEGLPQIEKIYDCRSIDLVSEPATTNGLYESDHSTGRKTESTEDSMELKDLTLDVLKKERSDLVEQILASIEEGKKVESLTNETQRLQVQLKESDEKIAKLELEIANRDAAEVKKQLEGEIAALIQGAKIPDSVKYEERDGQQAIKSHLLNIMNRCSSAEERKTVIADWEETYKGALTQESKKEKKSTVVQYEQKLGSGSLSEASVRDLASAFSLSH